MFSAWDIDHFWPFALSLTCSLVHCFLLIWWHLKNHRFFLHPFWCLLRSRLLTTWINNSVVIPLSFIIWQAPYFGLDADSLINIVCSFCYRSTTSSSFFWATSKGFLIISRNLSISCHFFVILLYCFCSPFPIRNFNQLH